MAGILVPEFPGGTPGSMEATLSKRASEDGLRCGEMELRSEGRTYLAYEARPLQRRPLSAILIFHEKFGLTPYLRDVARRLAHAGFLALAPDFTRLGGAREVAGEQVDEPCSLVLDLPTKQVLRVAKTFAEYLRLAEGTTNDLGVIGFCWGGQQAYRFAAVDKRLRAAVCFYGNAPDPFSMLHTIVCPLLGFYGRADTCTPPAVGERIEKFMRRYDKPFDLVAYPGAKHAFHNDTLPTHYHPEAAEHAFQRCITFFHRHLA